MLRLCLLLALCLPASRALAHAAAPNGAQLEGKPVAALAAPGTKAVVLFFVASDCPISNRTFPEMQRLRQAFTPRGIRFWFVYPNATEQVAGIRAHQAAFDRDGAAITDPDAALVHLTGSTVTPEAAILVPAPGGGWKTIYAGRVDDRFVSLGHERPRATRLLVDDALSRLLDGKAVVADNGKPVGCAIIPAGALKP